jgi:hypothetical protein
MQQARHIPARSEYLVMGLAITQVASGRLAEVGLPALHRRSIKEV